MQRIFGLVIAAALLAGFAPAQQNNHEAQTNLTSASAGTISLLPAGTALQMKLETPLSTRTSRAGEAFAGRITEPVMLDGKTVIPVGAALEGQVARVADPRRIKGKPMLDLRPQLVTLPNGDKLNVVASVVDTSRRPQTDVDDEGRIKGRGYDGNDGKEIALGTGAGLGVGALIGGGQGALLGAGIGAGATLTHWLTRHKSADLPAGTEIIMELSRPLLLSPEQARNAGKSNKEPGD